MTNPDLTLVRGGIDDVPSDDLGEPDLTVLAEDDPFLPVDDGELRSATVLFDGDQGRLDAPARRALQALLKFTFISGRRHPGEWKAFMANRNEITSRLNDQFLEVRVDAERQVAYKRPADADGPSRFPTLLHDSRWSREETVLLVHLRGLIRTATAAGHTRTFVDRDDLLEHLALMRPASATNRAKDRAAGERAIGTLRSAGILEGRADGARFEVDPVIEVLLPLERLEELLRWITAAPAERNHSADDQDPTAEEDTLL
jgi:hypothetical protein